MPLTPEQIQALPNEARQHIRELDQQVALLRNMFANDQQNANYWRTRYLSIARTLSDLATANPIN